MTTHVRRSARSRFTFFLVLMAFPMLLEANPVELPLVFVPNDGQLDRRVYFAAQSGGANFWFTSHEAVLRFANDDDAVALRLAFIGANPAPRISAGRLRRGTVNYLIGNDRGRWRTGLPTYGELVYHDLWPGIDLKFRGEQGRLKYEFHVAPGANVSKIRLRYRGADHVAIGVDGELLLQTALGTISDEKPVSYQLVRGERLPIGSHYVLDSRGHHGFAVSSDYDRRAPLIIDPGLAYSTYAGGSSGDTGNAIAVDGAGNAYVAVNTQSVDFPTTAGVLDANANGQVDVVIMKLNAAGSALVYSTYLGASGNDLANGITVAADGTTFVIGATTSPDFPTTAGAFDTTLHGIRDAFVTRLNATGTALIYSTYFGGSSDDSGQGIAIDATGNAFITGTTESADLPTTAGSFRTTINGTPGPLNADVFVAKLNPSGSAPLIYSTYLGGSNSEASRAIALDNSGNAYVTGLTLSANFPTTAGAFDTTLASSASDVFVTKLNATGSAPLIYSTYVGGSVDDSAAGIAVDDSGNAYVAGRTTSPGFPTTVGAFNTTYNGGVGDAFVFKLNSSGSALAYSTFLGAGGNEQALGIALDSGGNAYVTGLVAGPGNFPTTPDAFDTTRNTSGLPEVFVTKLNPAGSSPLLYSTFLGGEGGASPRAIAVDRSGNAYVTGVTQSTDFPVTTGAFDRTFNGGVAGDAFVTKFAIGLAAPATITLEPSAAANPIDTMHTVTATVEDGSANPVADITVRFLVSGSVTSSGSCETNAAGVCTFSYQGPAMPGTDIISAFADSDGDGIHDSGEPSANATKSWVLPLSSTGCRVTGGGWIIAANGDRATFGGNAHAGATLKGQQQYTDHGPASPLNVHSTTLDAVVCSSSAATVFGDAGSFTFRTDVRDGGNGDTYRIRLSNGYDSGEQVLGGGNIQIQNR